MISTSMISRYLFSHLDQQMDHSGTVIPEEGRKEERRELPNQRGQQGQRPGEEQQQKESLLVDCEYRHEQDEQSNCECSQKSIFHHCIRSGLDHQQRRRKPGKDVGRAKEESFLSEEG